MNIDVLSLHSALRWRSAAATRQCMQAWTPSRCRTASHWASIIQPRYGPRSVANLKHFWRAPGTCRANLMCNGARSLRQHGTIFAAATLQPALVVPRSAIAVRVAKRSPAIWQRHSHAKHHCYGARFDAAISHTLWLWLMAALLQTLLLLPSQAPFDLPCSSQRVLVAGTLATGATMMAAAVVAWRQQLAVQGSVLGATAFRRPQWPTAMR